MSPSLPPPNGALVRVTDADQAFYFHAATARMFATELQYDRALAVVAEQPGRSPARLRAELGQRLELSELEAADLVRELEGLGLLHARPLTPAAASRASITKLKLHVSGTCNLRCGYCYQGDATGKAARSMTLERARAAIDWLFTQGSRERPVELMFFGGEPLLNFPVVEAAARYAREQERIQGRPLVLSVITNGTLVTQQRAAILGALGVHVGISIDGDPSVHDRLRVFASGRGSYAHARQALGWLTEAGCRVHALITIARHNNCALRSVEHLLGEGFHAVKVTPVASTDPQLALDVAGYERLGEDLLALADRYAEQACAGQRYGFMNIHGDVAAVHAGTRKLYPCSAGLSSAACSPEGELYLCHRFTDREDFRLGSIDEGLDEEALDGFREQLHLHERTDCRACWARHLCGGGCHQHNELDNGDLRRATAARCDHLRAWYHKVLQVYARIATENPAFLDGR